MRLALLTTIGLLALAPAAMAETPSQFDLVCAGTVKNLDQVTSPWKWRLSVDVGRAAYVNTGSTVVQPIERIEPGRLVFVDSKTRDELGAETDIFSVSRSDGTVQKTTFRSGSLVIADVVTGTCAVAPFTPFPKNLF